MDFLRVFCRSIFLLAFIFHLSCAGTEDDSGDAETLPEGSAEVVDGEAADKEEEEESQTAEAPEDEGMDLDAELAKDEKSEKPQESDKSQADQKKENLENILSDDSSIGAQSNINTPRASIKDIKYLAQINGGTIAIELSKEAIFKVRKGKDEKQHVLEIPNTVLPDRFKRPYITKEFEGPFISFEAYQAASSSTTRLLVQQRIGGEPSVRISGLVLYVSSPERPILDEQMSVVSKTEVVEESALALPQEVKEIETVVDEGMVLKSKSLYEYLTSNNRFFGKKISLEVRGADVRDVLNFLAETSGLNMIVDDQVTGKVTMKLSKIPWDQALLLVLQTRRLGYLRQGNVLRIAPLASLREEADEASSILESRKRLEDLVVRIVLVSYGNAGQLAPQLKPFLSQRGNAVADARTSSIIITDVASNLDKVEKLIKSLDTPPPQVLIEGKVVEASEIFQRDIGLAWNASGESQPIGNNKRNGAPIQLTPSLAVSPGLPTSALQAGISIQNMNFFGDISATLAVYELEQKVKVLSSPRIATLHNVQSEITQNQQVPFLQPGTTGANGVPIATYGFRDVKLSLKVTPQVTSDESVILDLTIDRDVLGVIKANEIPTINQRHAQTRVLVKNGQTAVIGGIYQNDSTSSDTGVPLLKDIPILGWLFKSTTTKQQRNELLIFLTPRILSGPITSTIN